MINYNIEALVAIEELQATSSRLRKEAILKAMYLNEDFKDIMRFVFSPYITTGISNKKANRASDMYETAIEYNVSFKAVLFKFNGTTGTNDDLRILCNVLCSMPEKYQAIVSDIITKTLTIGVTAKTLNKIYGKDFIPLIGCMLGTSITKVSDKDKLGTWLVTKKEDGQRHYIIKELNGSVAMYSGRQGMPDNQDFPEILEEAKHLPAGYVYDGEMVAQGHFASAMELRQATNSVCAKKGIKTGVELRVFDMIPIEEYKAGKGSVSCSYRKEQLNKCIRNYGFIKEIPIITVIQDCDEEMIAKVVKPIWEAGDEGIMLNKATAPYELKRTKTLLKVKKVDTLDLRIVDVVPGAIGKKNEFRAGAFVVAYKGNTVNVGSGLNDSLREVALDNKDAYIGKIIEVSTLGESIDNSTGKLSLNSPIFICFRDDKTIADY